jgi:4-amino-4-deoxy-L-arabinose transferase-like glycosyltransferase
MRITTLELTKMQTGQTRSLAIPSERTLVIAALAAIVVLAAALRFANLAALGYANHYYTAAVASMLQSWHNFFFVAAEPGGSVSVDKPPVGLWLQAISAYFLGVNTLGILLPQLVAGILSVLVLYHLVQRSFGQMAGLVAALVLAVTPVAVATDRNNTIDSTLILTLLLAAWAFIKATESGQLRYVLLGTALVGLGFNIKMLEAFLPLPAFYALYLLGGKQRLLSKLARLAVATALLLIISLSWSVIVDVTPAAQRPYVGSSSNNSALNLIAGYNGLQRLVGMGARQNGNTPGTIVATLSRLFTQGGTTTAPVQGRDGTLSQGRQAPGGGFPGGGAPGGGFPGGAAGGRDGGGPGGGFDTGQAGLLRLFRAPLSKEASWLLIFGLVGALLVTLGSRLRWPVSQQHQAVVLWGGWLWAGGAFFSVAGFFHPYYLSTLGPPIAALTGMGAAAVWRLRQRRWWLAVIVLIIAVALTLLMQMQTAQAYLRTIWWQPIVVALAAVGVVLLVAARRHLDGLARVGLACVLAAMLVTPAIWSGLTVLNSSSNQSLPAAYDGQSSGPANRGGLQVNQELLTYLQAHTRGVKYLMAVPSSMQGADYVLATGHPVLYLGGFNGNDAVETADSLASLVTDGKLRFVYWGGQGGPGGQSQSGVTTWVSSNCTLVQGYDTTTQNAGAPDGTGAQQSNDGLGRGGMMQVTLYDCLPANG